MASGKGSTKNTGSQAKDRNKAETMAILNMVIAAVSLVGLTVILIILKLISIIAIPWLVALAPLGLLIVAFFGLLISAAVTVGQQIKDG